jgi:hypothetical protein
MSDEIIVTQRARYRAVIQYPEGKAGKPFQVYGARLDLLQDWCRIRAAKEPDGTPQPDGTEGVIYEVTERPVFRLTKRTDLAGEPVVTESAVRA